MFFAAPFSSEFLLNPPHLFDKHCSPQPGIWQAPSYAYISCAVVPTPSEWRNPTRPPLQPFIPRSNWGPLKDLLKRLSTPVTFSASSSCRQKRSNLSTPDSRNGLPFSTTNWVYSGQLHHHSSISLLTPHRLAQTPATGFCPDMLSFFLQDLAPCPELRSTWLGPWHYPFPDSLPKLQLSAGIQLRLDCPTSMTPPFSTQSHLLSTFW